MRLTKNIPIYYQRVFRILRSSNLLLEHLNKKIALSLLLLCLTEKKLGVRSTIRYTKMYSCAQCTMQKRSVCCRDVPCLAYMEQRPGPLHPEHLPPSLSAWVLGTQSTSSSQQGWTWTVEWTLASSPTQNLWPSKDVCQYCSLFPSSNTVFWNAYQMIICLVLIVVIFLGLINHNME